MKYEKIEINQWLLKRETKVDKTSHFQFDMSWQAKGCEYKRAIIYQTNQSSYFFHL